MEGPYPIILGLALAASAGCETSKTSPFEPGDIVVFTGIIFGERHDTTPVRCVGHWDRGCDVTTGTRPSVVGKPQERAQRRTQRICHTDRWRVGRPIGGNMGFVSWQVQVAEARSRAMTRTYFELGRSGHDACASCAALVDLLKAGDQLAPETTGFAR